MPKLFVTDREGAGTSSTATLGWSVMEIIRENNLPIEAACGGCCACATCHVYVDEDWLARLEPANPDESMMLDEAFEVRDNSRLSCQIKFTAALDGLALDAGAGVLNQPGRRARRAGLVDLRLLRLASAAHAARAAIPRAASSRAF